DLPQVVRFDASVVRQDNLHQPVLTLAVRRTHMNVRGLSTLVRVEVKSERANAKDGGHGDLVAAECLRRACSLARAESPRGRPAERGASGPCRCPMAAPNSVPHHATQSPRVPSTRGPHPTHSAENANLGHCLWWFDDGVSRWFVNRRSSSSLQGGSTLQTNQTTTKHG